MNWIGRQLLQKMQQLDLMVPREEWHFVDYKIYRSVVFRWNSTINNYIFKSA